MKKILIVDDEDSFRRHLSHLFSRRGYEVRESSTGKAALELVQDFPVDLVILDIILPDIDGIEILQKLKEAHPDIQVIMMTGNATVENAIASMKLGAYDYLIKPFDLEELLILVERARELSQLKRESEIFKRELDRQSKFDAFVGISQHSKNTMELVQKVAPMNSTILITGETGTGKELIAKAIHRYSPRTDRPFIVVNCSAIQDTLLESEMFGHEKGAFTGAIKSKRGLVSVASSGTLFLDEIGDVSPGFQTKLLRFLESGEYRPIGSTQIYKGDVRVIAATNKNLQKLLNEDKFREDLYYRLNVINIHLLPLRERMDDIPVLVEYCLKKICYRTGRCISQISDTAISLLKSYDWPGNVRELENVIERAVILCNSDQIEPSDLPIDIRTQTQRPESDSNVKSLYTIEKEHLLETLEKLNGNKTLTAKTLGITKKTLYSKLKKYGLM